MQNKNRLSKPNLAFEIRFYKNSKTRKILKFDNQIQGAKFNFTQICEKFERSFATNYLNSIARNNLKFHDEAKI